MEAATGLGGHGERVERTLSGVEVLASAALGDRF